jgi:WD40 repeat protein
VRLWDAKKGAYTQILQGHTANVSSVDWSRDGRWLASGSYDGSVRIWDVQEGTSRVGIEQTGLISTVAWSPDGALLASATDEGLVLNTSHLRHKEEQKTRKLPSGILPESKKRRSFRCTDDATWRSMTRCVNR